MKDEVLELHSEGMSPRDIALKLGVEVDEVLKIIFKEELCSKDGTVQTGRRSS